MKITSLLFCLVTILPQFCLSQDSGNIDLTPRQLINHEFVPNEKINTEDSCFKSMDFLKTFYKQLRYPPNAREKSVEGTVVLSLVIDPLGQYSDLEIVRDIGESCGTNALEALKESLHVCPDTIRLDGIPVTAKLFLPVNFKLH